MWWYCRPYRRVRADTHRRLCVNPGCPELPGTDERIKLFESGRTPERRKCTPNIMLDENHTPAGLKMKT